MVQTLQCPNCGAPQAYDGGGDPVITCPYCHSSVILPDGLLNTGETGQESSFAVPAALNTLLNAEQIIRLRQMGDLIRQGKKIEAVKLYRDVFGVGLKEASDAVNGLQAGRPVVIPSLSARVEIDDAATDGEIRRLAQSGKKIEAIKLYRQTYGLGLKESKEAVEFFITSGVLPTPQTAGASQMTDLLSETGAMLDIAGFLQSGDHESAAQRYAQAFNVTLEQANQALQGASQTLVVAGPGVPIQTGSLGAEQRRAAAAVVGAAGAAGGISCFALGITALVILSIVVPVFFALASQGGPLEGLWTRVNPLAFARLEHSFGEEGSGAGLLDDPRSLAVDAAGSVFVANYSDGRIQKFDASGRYQMLWNIGAEQYVQGIAVDRAGYVYAVYRGKISKFDGDDGRFIGEIIHPQEHWFEAVAATADGGLVAVVNTEDVLRYNADGQVDFSLAETGQQQTGSPDGVDDVVVDGVGNIYLLSDEDYVQVYSPTGRLLSRFGSDGDEQGQFRAPQDLAVDGQGRVYVSDINGIQVFASDGRYLDFISVEGVAFGMVFDEQGYLWLVSNRPRVMKYHIGDDKQGP